MPGRCARCGKDSVKVVQRDRKHQTRDGVSVAFRDELSVCANCGHEFYTIEQSEESSRALAAALREATDSPSPAAIRALRKRLGLTQAEMERIIGVGPKTFSRWENGTVAPSAAAATILWVAENYPLIVSRLAENRGVALSPRRALAFPIGGTLPRGTMTFTQEPSTRSTIVRTTHIASIELTDQWSVAALGAELR